MRKLIILFLISSSLFSLSLKQYIDLSLQNSNDARLLLDYEIDLKLDHDLQKNKYSSNYSPKSSFGVNNDNNTFTLGIQREQYNRYGGTFYSALEAKRTDYKDNQNTTYTPVFSVGYKQSLFRKFGKLYNTISIYKSKETLKLIKLIKKDTNADIILKATINYYDFLLYSTKIKIQEKALKRTQHNYDAAKEKYDSGIVSKIDVHRAKLSYLDQNKNLKDSIKRYNDSFENLYYYINQNSDDKLKQKDEISKIQYNFTDKIKDNILSNNLKWNEINLDEKFLERDLYNANKDYLPDVDLNLKYSLQSTDETFKDSFDLNNDNWSVEVGSNYSFNITTQKIKYQKLIIKKAKLKRDKSALKRLIFKDVKSLKNDYQNIIENLEIYILKKYEAKNSLDVAKIRYKRGLSSNLDILDAESIYSNSQVEYIAELVKHNITLLKLCKSMGLLDLALIKRITN